MITCVIIDDEQHCRESLEILIKKYCPELQIVSICENGKAGINSIIKKYPELVFLDISMPDMNGFQMLEKLESIEFEVIFTTAYDEYAVKAFKVNAVDYLMKPIDRKELVSSIEKVKKLIEMSERSKDDKRIIKLLDYHFGRESNHHISIPTSDGLELLNNHDILYCLAEGNYSRILLADSTFRFVSKPLGFLEVKLSKFSNFIRIHNSILINVNKLKNYVKGKGGYVIMQDGKMLNVSRQRKDELMKRLR